MPPTLLVGLEGSFMFSHHQVMREHGASFQANQEHGGWVITSSLVFLIGQLPNNSESESLHTAWFLDWLGSQLRAPLSPDDEKAWSHLYGQSGTWGWIMTNQEGRWCVIIWHLFGQEASFMLPRQ